MKLCLRSDSSVLPSSLEGFPSASELAMLRVWCQGVDTREAVARYLGEQPARGKSSRSIGRRIRNQLPSFAHARLRPNLAQMICHREWDRTEHLRVVFHAIETLRTSASVTPQLSDAIERWLAPSSVAVLHACDIRTLTGLTVRIPR